jgi:hypothetical protein
LLTEFAENIVRPYYSANINVAIQDLIHKALAEQELVLSHITQEVGKTRIGQPKTEYKLTLYGLCTALMMSRYITRSTERGRR